MSNNSVDKSTKKTNKETTKKSTKDTTKKSPKKTYKRKTKQYSATVTLPDGTRKYLYGHTKAEAAQKAAELRAEIAGGVDVTDDTTFGELAKLWIDKYCAPYHRRNTVNTYRSAINTHLMPRLATLPVKSITSLHIQAVMSDAIKSGYESISNLIRIMRDIFNVGVDIGCILKSPVPASLKAPPRKDRAQKQVLARELEGKILRTLKPLTQERLAFIVGVHSGLRRGEIYGLDWKYIDLDDDILYVRQQSVRTNSGRATIEEDLKTESGRREVPISPTLKKELLAWGEWYGTSGLLFADDEGNPLGDGTIRGIWTRIRQACEIHDPEYAEKFTMHVLRHTYITRLFEAGLDIKEIQSLAGHKDVNTTLSVYTHFDKGSRQRSTFDKVRNALESNSATSTELDSPADMHNNADPIHSNSNVIPITFRRAVNQ